MMTPRLQMNTPCTYNLDSVYSIDSSSYMRRSGFLKGIEEAWTDCVKKMYEEFDASFAANEGLAAVVRDLTPSKRHLKVNRLSKRRCSIECEHGTILIVPVPFRQYQSQQSFNASSASSSVRYLPETLDRVSLTVLTIS